MPLSEPLTWYAESKIMTVSARGSLQGLLARLRAEKPDWVVIVRVHLASGVVFRYVWLPVEIVEAAARIPTGDWQEDLEVTLRLHEYGSSRVSRGRRPVPPRAGASDDVTPRHVDLDAIGQVAAIGVPRRMARQMNAVSQRRGGSTPAPDAQHYPACVGKDGREPQVDTMISAQGPSEVALGQLQVIEFRIEIRDDTLRPLATRFAASFRPDMPIVVDLSIESPALAAAGPVRHVVAAPQPGEPRFGFFQVRGDAAGVVQLALTFRQGAGELGSIGLSTEVVVTHASSTPMCARSQISTPDLREREMLQLLIEQRLVDGELRYEYKLHSEALKLDYLTLHSKKLLDRSHGAARTLLDYLDRIYERMTAEVRSARDLDELQGKMRALGGNLSLDLFDQDIARTLWPLRHRIGSVRLISWEPYVPWEMLRLHNPDQPGDFDDRFLAEYGLIRWLPGLAAPRNFALKDWCWLAAEFPHGTHMPPGGTRWFSDDLRTGFAIDAVPVAAKVASFLALLHDGAFDVLHVACHAESSQDRIDHATLILGDRISATGQPELIQLAPEDVRTEARLSMRQPIVFLNACESGRLAPDLTAWGGWPEVFLKAGAGAFVGTSWAVRDKSASAFSQSFYEALLGGKPLHEAARLARTAAKAIGDASWLAFKVYGHPFAARVG